MRKLIKKNWRGQIVIKNEQVYHKLIMITHAGGHDCGVRRYKRIMKGKSNARKVVLVQG